MRQAFLFGNSRLLVTVFAMLAALVTSLALYFSLGTKPAVAQDVAQDKGMSDATAEEASGDVNAQAIFTPDKKAVIERSPSAINFGSVKVGDSKEAIVTVTGVENGCNTIFLGGCFGEFGGGIGDPPTLSGPNAGNFAIIDNNCKGKTLWANSSCQITLRFSSNNAQNFNATLTIPPHPNGATEFRGGNTVELSGAGFVPDTTPPTVTSFSPTGSKVSPSANITAKFSEDLQASSVNDKSFTLTQSDGTSVSATVTYDGNTDTATLDPSGSLKRGVTYKAKLSSEIKDLAGNSLVEKEWTFKVAKKKGHHHELVGS